MEEKTKKKKKILIKQCHPEDLEGNGEVVDVSSGKVQMRL